MTRSQKIITLSTKRARYRERITKAEASHKATAGLRVRLVDATTQQLRAETIAARSAAQHHR